MANRHCSKEGNVDKLVNRGDNLIRLFVYFKTVVNPQSATEQYTTRAKLLKQ